MEKYLSILAGCKLFQDVSCENIFGLLDSLNASIKTFPKNSYIYSAGDSIEKIGILLSGSLLIQHDDFWGNRSIVRKIDVGDMFGESYASNQIPPIINDVITTSDSKVVFLDINKILKVCLSSWQFHSIIIENLFEVISEKNRSLVEKLSYLSKRTTREKVISYLSDQAKFYNSNEFFIPFNRQELADFLSVDRSALSSELGKLRDCGKLKFQRNKFVLLNVME